MREQWKPCPEFEESYHVSDRGRVKSLERLAPVGHGAHRMVRERILKQFPSREGYLQVGLHRDGRRYSRAVHVLVLTAFRGPKPKPPPGAKRIEGCHNNGNTEDNRLVNLRWDTPANNQADKISHRRRRGRRPGGPVCEKGHRREQVGVNDLGEPLYFCRECHRERGRAWVRPPMTDEQREHARAYQREYQREYYRRTQGKGNW